MPGVRSLFLLAAVAAFIPLSNAGAQDTVKVGVITDKVGSGKFYAEPVSRGVELGTKVINDKGGVLGKKIQLLTEDDPNKPDVSAPKARKLVDSIVLEL